MAIDLGDWEKEKDKKGKGVSISDRARGKTVTVPDDSHRILKELAASKGMSMSEFLEDLIRGASSGKETTGDLVSAAKEQERIEWFDSKTAEHKAERLKRLNEIKQLERRLESGESVSDAEISALVKKHGLGSLSSSDSDEDARFDRMFSRILKLKELEVLSSMAGSGGGRASGTSGVGGAGGAPNGSGGPESVTTNLMNTLLSKIIEKEFGGGGGTNSELEQGLNTLASEVDKLHDTVASLTQTSPLSEIESAMDKVFGFYTKLDELKQKGESLGFMPKKLEDELDKKTLGKFGKFMSATKEFMDIADKAAGTYRKAISTAPMPDVELPPPE